MFLLLFINPPTNQKVVLSLELADPNHPELVESAPRQIRPVALLVTAIVLTILKIAAWWAAMGLTLRALQKASPAMQA